MRMFIWLLIGLLCVAGVVAEQMDTYVGQQTTITTACIRNSQMRGDALAMIIIYDANGTVVVPQSNMSSSGNGTFSYVYTFDVIGGYSTRETCDFGGILADGSTSINVIKPNFGSMQVVAQGTAQVDLGKVVVSEWLILLPNSTNSTVSDIQVIDGACNVMDLLDNPLNVSVFAITTNDKMTATFTADPVNFVEGMNYQVLCNITFNHGMYVNGVKNYVYITPHTSFLQYILQLIGLAEDTQASVNETLSISNQTLQIVTLLNSTIGTIVYEQIPHVELAQSNLIAGRVSKIVAEAYYGSNVTLTPVCEITVFYQNLSRLVDNQSMIVGIDVYEYDWLVPLDANGKYATQVECTGGDFGMTRVYAFESLDVVLKRIAAVIPK